MKVITPENDARRPTDEELVEKFGRLLYEAFSKGDFKRWNLTRRRCPRGLLSKILVREAELAIAANGGKPMYRFSNATPGGAWLVEKGTTGRWCAWSELRALGATPDHRWHRANFIDAPDITKGPLP